VKAADAATSPAAERAGSTTLYFGPWYRRSPFFEATLRHGCTAYDIYNHMYLPAYYHDPVEEYWHLLKHVTIWDVGVERIVEITGPDAFTFTNRLTCRDLNRCAVGQGKYAPIIDEHGGIINDPVLLRLGPNHFWLALADSDVLLWAKGVALHSGLSVELKEPDVAPIQIQGPDSKPVMRALFGDAILGLKYYFCLETRLDDIPVVVSRTGWTAEVGYEIYLRDGSRGDELWERVMAAGKAYGIMPIAPCEARRLEAGIFNYGSDMRLENNPFEVTGLERLVELDGADDFIGRGALERIKAAGVTRKLVGIEIGGASFKAELTSYWPVEHEGSVVGHVTDAIYSPRLERNIGYAWVPIALAPRGTRLVARTPGGPLPATVAGLPFIDPKKAIPAQ
jgi:glycine cleavage system aminomethyltransferase T